MSGTVSKSIVDSPWRLRWPAWRSVMARTWRQTGENNIALAAAGVAFYGFVAMVPLLGAVVLGYGFIASPFDVVAHMQELMAVMPMAAAKLVGDQLMTIVTASSDKKGLGLILALVVALYGVRSAAAAIITGLNIAYGEKESRGFLKLTGLSVAVAMAGIVIVMLALSAIAALGHLESLFPKLPPSFAALGKIGFYFLLVLSGAAGAATLYRYGPDRKKARWIWITPGSLLSAATWLLLSLLFGIYVADFGRYNATYGSLGAVVIFLTWLYLSSYVLLIGAEINAQLERFTPNRSGRVEAPSTTPALDTSAVAPVAVLDSPGDRRAVDSIASEPFALQAGAFIFGRASRIPATLACVGIALLRRRDRPVLGTVLLASAGLLAYAKRGKSVDPAYEADREIDR